MYKFISEIVPNFVKSHTLTPEWVPGSDPFVALAKNSGKTREEELRAYCRETGLPMIPISLLPADEAFVMDPRLPIVYVRISGMPSLTALTSLPVNMDRTECGDIASLMGAESLHFAILEYDDLLTLVRIFNPPQSFPKQASETDTGMANAKFGTADRQNSERKILGKLSEKGVLNSPEERFAAAAVFGQYPALNSLSIAADEMLYGVISAESAEGYGACPIARNGENYVFACSQNLDNVTASTLRAKLPRNTYMQLVLVPPNELGKLVKFYSVALTTRNFTKRGDLAVRDEYELNVHEIRPDETRESLKRELGASSFTDALLLRGYQEKASDIHLSMVRRSLRIRLRVNGILHDIQEENMPYDLCQAVLSRIKILAGIDVQRKELPQDGQFKFRVTGSLCEVRVNSSETVEGAHIVMRLQMPNDKLSQLESLGIDPYELSVISQAVDADNGMFVICGPTGSGKSTTLYAALESIDRIRYKVISGEQPVERKIANVEQTHIKKGSSYSFSEFVVAAMRQDPDYILIGETRDSETAKEILRAAITGHVVLTTLHTNTAAMAPMRLTDLTGEPFLIADAMTALCSQRLLPKLCPYCKEAVPVPPPSKLKEMGIREEWIAQEGFSHSRGCQYCHFTGTSARVCIMEGFLVTSEIRDMISRRASSREIAEAQRSLGSMGLYEKAVRRAAAGEVSLADALPLKICGF